MAASQQQQQQALVAATTGQAAAAASYIPPGITGLPASAAAAAAAALPALNGLTNVVTPTSGNVVSCEYLIPETGILWPICFLFTVGIPLSDPINEAFHSHSSVAVSKINVRMAPPEWSCSEF